MRRRIPLWKTIYVIITVLLIVGMNIFAAVGSVRAVLARQGPVNCSDPRYVIDNPEVIDGLEPRELDEPYSGTITEIEQTPDSIYHIRVENKDGERWFTSRNAGTPSGIAYKVGNEVTFRCAKDDPDNRIVSVLKNNVPDSVKIREAIQTTLFWMLIPDTVVLVLLKIVYRIIERAKNGENVLVPVLVLCTCLFALAGLVFYVGGYIRRAKAAAAPVAAHAPVIYLYNDDDTLINVSIDLRGEFTYTYPVYDEDQGWTVTASPDGTLTDSEGMTYDFLFWEGNVYMEPDLSRGFCVAGEDTEAFLRDAAYKLGLNDNETEFFVSYWTPYMERNAYNVITFQTTAFDEAAVLRITPEPDVLLRVNMLWYPSEEYVVIEEQDLSEIGLPLSERHGFTAVEWGGEMLG